MCLTKQQEHLTIHLHARQVGGVTSRSTQLVRCHGLGDAEQGEEYEKEEKIGEARHAASNRSMGSAAS